MRFCARLKRQGRVGAGTGWQPSHMAVFDEDLLVGAMPLYVKTHSYGEYVFDWAWAEAYTRNGLNYYPKLLSAIPFTPITSSRLLTSQPGIRALIVKMLTQVMQQNSLSSAHVLFPDDESASAFRAAGWLERTGVQFRWQNENFKNFDAFLATLSHDKRKKSDRSVRRWPVPMSLAYASKVQRLRLSSGRFSINAIKTPILNTGRHRI